MLKVNVPTHTHKVYAAPLLKALTENCKHQEETNFQLICATVRMTINHAEQINLYNPFVGYYVENKIEKTQKFYSYNDLDAHFQPKAANITANIFANNIYATKNIFLDAKSDVTENWDMHLYQEGIVYTRMAAISELISPIHQFKTQITQEKLDDWFLKNVAVLAHAQNSAHDTLSSAKNLQTYLKFIMTENFNLYLGNKQFECKKDLQDTLTNTQNYNFVEK
jgi:hypothetical protein